MEEPKAYIDLLSKLLVPVKSSHLAGEQDGDISFTNLLKEALLRFTTHIQKLDKPTLDILESDIKSLFTADNNISLWQTLSDPSQLKSEKDLQIKWFYAVWNLVLLQQLATCIQASLKVYHEKLQQSESSLTGISGAPPMSPDTLSFSEQKTVTTCIQFIVCLGILPYLQPGVGVPFERRSEFSHLHKEFKLSGEICKEEQESRLLMFSISLTGLSDSPAIGTLITSRHLGDLLAALLQLVCSSTLKKKQSKVVKCTEPVTEVKPATKALYRTLKPEDFQSCENSLRGLLDKVYPPALVQELLTLQGGAPPAPGKGVLVKSPVWLKCVCGKLLSDILVKPKGVQFVLRDSTGRSALVEMDWKKCDAVSRIIANCPRKSASIEEYYKLMAPQVIELLHAGGKELGQQFLRVAVGTITAMVTQHPVITKKYIFCPLLGPFYTCINHEGETDLKEEAVVVGEQTLTSCLDNAHRLFVVGMEPQSILLTSLQEIIHVVFTLYCAIHSGVLHIKSQVEELLLCYLRQSDSHVCAEVIQLFVFGNVCKLKSIPLVRSGLSFSPGSHGGVKVIHSDTSMSEDWENRITCVIDLLVKSKNDQLTAHIFIDLLKELTCIISEELVQNQSVEIPPAKCSLLEFECAEDRLMSNVIMLSLLASMCDTLGDTCFKSTTQILEFVKVTLERCVMVLRNTDEELTSVFGSETVTMAMGLLTAVMGGASEVSSTDRDKTKELLPLLQTLSEEHQDETVKEMATDLRIAIATHGFVLSEALRESVNRDKQKTAFLTETKQRNPVSSSQSNNADKTDSKMTRDTNKPQSKAPKKPLIEIISSTEFEENKEVVDMSHGVHNNTTDNAEVVVSSKSDREYRENYKPGAVKPQSTSSLEQAFQELLDPLVPVRGHALISLRRLLEQRNPETLAKQNTLVKIFHENLDHSDTYIYLSAIQGLAVLALRLPDQVLPLLAEEYVNFDRIKLAQAKSKECETKVKERSPELRMKLGEVLMKCIRELGDTAPKYRDMVLRSLLSGTRDKDTLVRASALSNLGEICKLLRFSLGNIIYEILECVTGVLKSEQEVEVKRAAVVVLSAILQGLGSNTLKVLDSALRDVYHLLKHVKRTETDQVLLLHTDTALDVLDSFMREILFPKQTLTKKISVLDPPGNS